MGPKQMAPHCTYMQRMVQALLQWKMRASQEFQGDQLQHMRNTNQTVPIILTSNSQQALMESKKLEVMVQEAALGNVYPHGWYYKLEYQGTKLPPKQEDVMNFKISKRLDYLVFWKPSLRSITLEVQLVIFLLAGVSALILITP